MKGREIYLNARATSNRNHLFKRYYIVASNEDIFPKQTVPTTYVLHLLALQPARSDCDTSGVTPSTTFLVQLPRVKPFKQWHSLVKDKEKDSPAQKEM